MRWNVIDDNGKLTSFAARDLWMHAWRVAFANGFRDFQMLRTIADAAVRFRLDKHPQVGFLYAARR